MSVKKLLIIVMALVLLMTGCSSANEWDESTVTAQVTDIQGRKVTLALGEMAEAKEFEMPEGFEGGMPRFEKGERPEMPEGFEGKMPEGMELPEGFEGKMPENFEMPEGGFDRPQMGGMGFDMSSLFTANGKTVTVELSQSVVDGIAVDDIVQVTFGKKNVVENIVVMGGNMGGFGGMMPFDFENFKPQN